MNISTEKGALILVAVAVILAVAGFLYWKVYYKPPVREAAPAEATSTDLGVELYNQANNPVAGKLPENVNPLEGVYKNPFQ